MMGDWKTGEEGMKFKEVANELGRAVLKNRGRQETRWARADLCAKEAFFRNAPTIYNCYGREANKYRMQRDNTNLKIVEKKLDMLRDAEFWMHLLGLVQILNIVVQASLEAQHEKYFSTSSLFLVTNAMEKIRHLSERWEWETEDLFFAGIGSPASHIANISDKNEFKPVVSSGAKKRAARMISSLRAYRTEMSNLPPDESDNIFHEEVSVGTIPILNFEAYKEIKVMRHMEDICRDLLKNFEDRLRPSPLLKAAVEAFHSDFSWFEVENEINTDNGEEEGEDEGVGNSEARLEELLLQHKSLELNW